MTSRLSRLRANTFCLWVLAESCTRSCIARVTSAFASRCPQCRGSDKRHAHCRMLPYVVETPFWSTFFQRRDVADDFRPEPIPFCSYPCIGDIKRLGTRQHQQTRTQDVAIVQVPDLRQTSTLLERVSGVVRTRMFLGAAHSLGPAPVLVPPIAAQ